MFENLCLKCYPLLVLMSVLGIVTSPVSCIDKILCWILTIFAWNRRILSCSLRISFETSGSLTLLIKILSCVIFSKGWSIWIFTGGGGSRGLACSSDSEVLSGKHEPPRLTVVIAGEDDDGSAVELVEARCKSFLRSSFSKSLSLGLSVTFGRPSKLSERFCSTVVARDSELLAPTFSSLWFFEGVFVPPSIYL